MTPPALDHHKFAPPASSPGACAKGGRRFPLLASAATSLDDVQQRSIGTALGLRLVMCRSTSAVRRTGRRFAGLGCHGRGFSPAFRGYVPPKHLAGRFGVRSSFRAIDGIEAGSSHLVANLIQHRRQRGFQAFAERLPCHSSAPAVYVLKRRCGVIGSAQKAIGVYQNDDC